MRTLSVVIRVLLVPVHLVLVWLYRLEMAMVRPRYAIRGACQSNGMCCHRLLLAERPLLTWPVLRALTHFWMERIYPFVITSNAVEDPDSNELYRIVTCRNLVNRRCAEYLLRPRVCREWPVPADGAPPVLFHGCGFTAVDRDRGDDQDASRRRGGARGTGADDLMMRWRRR
ncbi:MAG: hypothetical protein ABIJ09_01800 [Pseudomonadota bacterium]